MLNLRNEWFFGVLYVSINRHGDVKYIRQRMSNLLENLKPYLGKNIDIKTIYSYKYDLRLAVYKT
jgi:hypothetical protein